MQSCHGFWETKAHDKTISLSFLHPSTGTRRLRAKGVGIVLPSFHDDYVIGYSVDCLSRCIEVKIGSPDWKGGGVRTLVFGDVERYHFENDAFGNIIASLEEVAVEHFLAEYREEIQRSFRMSGALGEWVNDFSGAPNLLGVRGTRGFILTSSLGLSGWILAKEASVVPVPCVW